ncbi:MAG: Rho-binding antiterminator [Cyclobacteriaceae bacterium]
MYKPINCSFYDLLEQAATLGTACSINYKTGDKEVVLKGKIIDLYIRQKVEYLKLDTGEEIRLDSLVSLNGTNLTDFDGPEK